VTETRIDHVTLYASGARVRRVATLARPLPATLRLGDLPIAVIDDTVRVELSGGGAIVRAVRTSLDVPTTAPEAEHPEDLLAARTRVAYASAEVERLTRALEQTTNTPVVVDDPSDDAPAAWPDIVAARRVTLATMMEREAALRPKLVAAVREREVAEAALRVISAREAAASTARGPKVNELRKVVDVELELDASASTGEVLVHLDYQIAAARWAPTYVARLDGDTVRVELRAVVAQASGEDWTNVGLALSTAEPSRFAPLPELHAQRIGRRQEAPAPAGFRAPPTGARALYADYERVFGGRPARVEPKPPVEEPAAMLGGIAGEVWDDGESDAKEAFHTPPAGSLLEDQLSDDRPSGVARGLAREGAAGGGGPQAKSKRRSAAPMPLAPAASAFASYDEEKKQDKTVRPPEPEPAAGGLTPRLDYGNLVMAPPSSRDRGALVPAARNDNRTGDVVTELLARARTLAALALPPGCHAGWDHAYDYAYAAEGRVDITADNAWTSLAVVAQGGTAKLRHVAVPREQPDAFRVATIANPFAGPLLPGPIDIYDRGSFLVTSLVEFTPPGGVVEIGLGVDPMVKLARNTEFREEAAGMLRGKLQLHHTITIEIEVLGTRPVELEVRERIPVAREGDDDIEVVLGKVEPAWEAWSPPPDSPRDRRLRGGRRWRVQLAAGAKRTLRASYEVKIASKHELVGGNRRER